MVTTTTQSIPKLGPGTYYADTASSFNAGNRLASGHRHLTVSPTQTASDLRKHPHHKLTHKHESYSSKGLGNGFVSMGDRFTGVHEAKFQLIAWFKNSSMTNRQSAIHQLRLQANSSNLAV